MAERVRRALDQAGGNTRIASAALGVSRGRLLHMMRKLALAASVKR